ncbi:MAG: hypothetical protein PHT81_04420 [Endomicrobiaceae bacterium]|nr:hypothetical protein [Endomicrobiaceae bacterium]
MPEYKNTQRINQFNYTKYIFDKNYYELIECLSTYCDGQDAVSMMDVNKRHKMNSYQKEILRHTHNFVASVQSLIDHSRNLYKNIESVFTDYPNKIETTFTNNPLTQFVICLRQFFQHYKIPYISASLRFDSTQVDFEKKILLNKNDLLEFDSWKSSAKEYLNSHKDNIDLYQTIKDYYIHITDFYHWFYNRLNEIYKNDIEKVNNKYTEYKKGTYEISILQIKSSIDMFKNDKCKVYDILNDFFSDEELYVLEKLENNTLNWMRKATDILKDKIPLPKEIQEELINLVNKKI